VAAPHVSVEVAVPPATRLTEGTGPQVRPAEGFAVKVTVPAKLFSDLTVIVDVPGLVARILAGETGPAETLKSGPAADP